MRKIVIMGAAGKDFHVFNTCYRGKSDCQVVAFTATQVPNIDDRKYPSKLAGPGYPDGIPIKSERFINSIVKDNQVDEVIFAYSDVSYKYIEEKRLTVERAGAEFKLADPLATMLKARVPVIAICAVRTGAGKSQTTRYVASLLHAKKKRVVVVRHPMPYGDLVSQEVQRYVTLEDLVAHHCTLEEMEEYEPHLQRKMIVYAGVDYEKILRAAEKEADIIVWDGGNNDTPFYKPDMHVVVADPLRAGQETTYYPGRVNFEMADVIIINKVDSATPQQVSTVADNAKRLNPKAQVVMANSPIFVDDPLLIKDKRVLALEDGPTVTHGDMKFGAAYLAAKRYGAKEVIDPRPFAVGGIADAFKAYPSVTEVLPTIGYGKRQIRDLEATIARAECDTVVIGTPVNLLRVLKIDKPCVMVTYELEEVSGPGLAEALERFV